MTTADRVYGRTQTEWDKLTDAGHRFLVEHARLGRPTSYTELNAVISRRTGLPEFNFERADERAAMGHLLGLIVERDLDRSGLMLSAIVNYLGENDAGAGFYAFAKELGLLPKTATAAQKWDFWASQVSQVFAYYSRP